MCLRKRRIAHRKIAAHNSINSKNRLPVILKCNINIKTEQKSIKCGARQVVTEFYGKMMNYFLSPSTQ